MFKTNEYFDGMVKSIAFTTPEGDATIGVMAKGEYEFSTSTIEHMSLTFGKMKVQVAGEENFREVACNEIFVIQANSSFKVVVSCDSSYLCLYK